MANKKKTVAKKSTNLPAVLNLENDAGSGFEAVDRDSVAIPFLAVLQKGSPQCDEDDDAYIDGAKAGMFFNTATGQIFDGKKGVTLIPAYFERMYVEWAPRDSGGGFRGTHDPAITDVSDLERDAAGRLILTNMVCF